MKKYLFSFIFYLSIVYCLLYTSNCFGQNPKTVDSLSTIWNDNAQSDTSRLSAVNQLFILFQRSNPDSAMALANRELIFAQKTKQKLWEAKAFNSIAGLYYYKGNNAIAIEYYQKALSIYIELKDMVKSAQTLHQMGVVEYYDGTYDKAMSYDLKSLKYFEGLNDENGIADIHHDIGKVFYRQKIYDQALRNYQESLDMYNKLGNKHGAASSLNNMAGVYGDKEEYEKMLFYLQQSLKLVEELGEKNGIATRVHNIGFVYQKLKKYDLAMNYFEKGLKIREEIMDKKGISYSLNSIGQVYSEKGNQEKAIEYLNKSLAIAKETGVKEAVKSSYEELSKVNYRMNKYKEAYDYHLLLMQIKDSIFTEESSHQIASMQTKFESEKKEKELQLQKSKLNEQNAELKKQRTEKIALFIGLSLLILLAVVLVRSNKNMKRAHTIISRQKKIVEEQKEAVENQKEIVEEKNKNITDSINYAKRIQNALLQSEKEIKVFLPDYFILFKPKDIVSGDFYWFYEKEGLLYFSVVDCTGHGVPGAFMSMLGLNFLNDILQTEQVTSPAYILNRLSEKVIERLKQKDIESQTRDGMDMALCSLLLSKNKLQFSGANNPLIIIRNKQIIQMDADRTPIGHQGIEEVKEFTTKEMDVESGDCIYLFSDGYSDQFGGEKGKKFKVKKLIEILNDNSEKPMHIQKQILEKTFSDWKGNMEQVDDVCIVGVKL